eukprot:s1027_g2.t1
MDFRGKGLLKRWDAQNPVHFIGHSFGGNTAVALYNMVAEDYWGLGTGPDWVASVSAVCSPLRGCSLPFLLGLVEVTDQDGCTRHTVEPGSFTHGMVASCCLIIKAQDCWPSVFKRLFNFKSDQWAEHNTWSNLVSARHPYVLSGDNMMSEIAPRTRRRALRGRMENLSKTYLIAITSDALAPLSPQQLLRRLIFSAAAFSGLSMSALILAFQRRASLLRLWESLKARSWHPLALPSLGDPKFLRRILVEMQKTDKTPWKCLYCKQLRKCTATHCTTCRVPWQQAMDRSYVHGVKQGSHQDAYANQYPHQYANQWSGYQSHGVQQYQGDPGTGQRAQSPRSQNKGKNSPRGKGQGKDFGNFQFPPPPQLPYQPPYAPPMAPLPPPATPAPWMQMQPQQMQMPPHAAPAAPHMPMQGIPQMSAVAAPVQPMMQTQCVGPVMPMPMPTPALPQNSQEAAQKELIAYIRNRQADLPPDMQKRVKDFSRIEGAKLTKDLQEAATILGEARTELEEALAARAQHIGTWKLFLAEAVKNWTEYGNLFDAHERSLQARIAQAKIQFQEARDCVEESKVAAGAVTTRVQEISDDEDLQGTSEKSARQIKESILSLSTSLTQLQKEAEAIKVEVPASKRQRRDEVSANPGDQPMGPGEPPFGGAG